MDQSALPRVDTNVGSDQTNQTPSFEATWASTDSTHLQPSFVPLKHIPRAWERKPQSPLAKREQHQHQHHPTRTRKIWRRHDFPQSHSTTKALTNTTTKPVHKVHYALSKKAFPSSPSPRKIVKKRCVHTLLGQKASANHWDLKASTPLRKSESMLFAVCNRFLMSRQQARRHFPI